MSGVKGLQRLTPPDRPSSPLGDSEGVSNRKEAEMSKLVRPAEVCERLDVSRTTLWRMVRDGHFPEPGKLSPNKIAWSEAVVSAWFAERFGEVVPAAPKAQPTYPSHQH